MTSAPIDIAAPIAIGKTTLSNRLILAPVDGVFDAPFQIGRAHV